MKWNANWVLSAFILGLTACSDKSSDKVIPLTVADVIIKDSTGAKLQGVQVSLYNSQQDWVKEQNPVQTATTAATGIARFVHLTDSVYFINAVLGQKTNWENSYKLVGLQQGMAHAATITIGAYQSKHLASPEGKIWRVFRYKVNGADVTQDSASRCLTDNFWVFFKGDRAGRFELRENSFLCTSTAPPVSSGSWQITPQGTTLNLPENNQVVSYAVHYLSGSVLRISKQDGTTLKEYTLLSP